jgi:hypothetical protein
MTTAFRFTVHDRVASVQYPDEIGTVVQVYANSVKVKWASGGSCVCSKDQIRPVAARVGEGNKGNRPMTPART